MIVDAFVLSIIDLVRSLIFVYIWVLIIDAVMSWVNPDPYNPIVSFIRRITHPLYDLVRRYINLNFNGIDFTPFLILILLNFLYSFLGRIAY